MQDFPNLNPKEFSEILTVTEEMRLLRTDPSRLNLGDYKDLLSSLCGALGSAREAGLDDAIRLGSEIVKNPETAEAIRSIGNDLDAFIRFVRFERDTLTACGVSAETANTIAAEVFNLREYFSRPVYDADEVIASLDEGHREICKASAAVTRYTDSEHQLHEDKKRALLTYGAAVTIANSVGTAITLGAALPILGMSAAGGSLMIVLRGTLEDPREKPPLQ